jgi:hypothetical protein
MKIFHFRQMMRYQNQIQSYFARMTAYIYGNSFNVNVSLVEMTICCLFELDDI